MINMLQMRKYNKSIHTVWNPKTEKSQTVLNNFVQIELIQSKWYIYGIILLWTIYKDPSAEISMIISYELVSITNN